MLRSSSKRDFRVVSDGPKRFRVHYRWRKPTVFQHSSWQFLRTGGIYHDETWQSSTCHDAEAAIDSLLREDDPPPWVEVTCGSIP